MWLEKAYQFVLHLASWLAVFLMVVMLAPQPHFNIQMPKPPFPVFFLVLVPMLAAFYYGNKHYLIPKFLGKHQKLPYQYSIIASGLFFLMLPFFHFQSVLPLETKLERDDLLGINILLTILLFNGVFIVSSGQAVVKYWFSAERKKLDLEFEKTVTELSFLKSQVNPHFLFNTLNNIYTLAILKSDKTPEAILKLADMMRYVLTDVGEKEAPIEQEIEYMEKFIALQKMRLTDKVEVDFQVIGETNGIKIAPLLHMPFIENAFKFGISTRLQSHIKILLQVKPKTVIFQVENQVFEEKISKMLSTGTGLKNVKRRLELLYPNNHWLRAETINQKFFVDLILEF